MDTISIRDLEGSHLFGGIERGLIAPGKDVWGWSRDAANTCTILLGDKAYMFVEDPSDGYRSSLDHVIEVDPAEVKNRFTPLWVIAKYRNTPNTELGGYSYSKECDLLEFRDVTNDKVIFTAGTDNTDDYYPSFVADWRPENMSYNDAKESAQ